MRNLPNESRAWRVSQMNLGYSTEDDLPTVGRLRARSGDKWIGEALVREDNVTVTEDSGTWTTKDSGRRAQFSNGGVRDTEEGKPRFDLLNPKTVPYKHQMLTRWAELMGRGARKYNDRNWEQFGDEAALDRAKSSALRHLQQLINGEKDEDHAAAVMFNVMVIEYVNGVLAGEWKALPALESESSEVELWEGGPSGQTHRFREVRP